MPSMSARASLRSSGVSSTASGAHTWTGIRACPNRGWFCTVGALPPVTYPSAFHEPANPVEYLFAALAVALAMVGKTTTLLDVAITRQIPRSPENAGRSRSTSA